MTEIITINQIQINGAETNSVNSRDIYEYLEVETAYTTWFNRAVEKYDFIEGQDFISFLKESSGGRPEKIFVVTIDMAKELCMVSNTPKGKETRKYFIAVEKEANKPKVMTLEDIVHQSGLLVQAKVAELENKLNAIEIKNDKIIEDVVELIEINTIAETKPLPRYHAVGFYQGRYGMSNHKIKEMIGVFGPKTCRCSKNIEGLVSEYQAYFMPDMDDAFRDVKSSSTKISKTKFTSPYLKGKFEIN